MAGKQVALEAAIWAAIVALEEKADLCKGIAKRMHAAGRTSQIERYRSTAATIEQQLVLLRQMVGELIEASPLVEEQGGTSA
jgi:hypothetical protein